MKNPLSILTVTALSLLSLISCGEKGSDEPHYAVLYDLCEVSEASASSPVTLLLYLPDSDEAVTLTAQAGALGSTPPEAGTPVMIAYTPQNQTPYTSSPITLYRWSEVTCIPIHTAKETADLDGWDDDPVWLISSWRAGTKICLRLKLGYDTTPRRMGLIIDPATVDDPVPTAYLYHDRQGDSPTFDRQYYLTFDIASLWDLPEIEGLRVIIADAATADGRKTILFKKPQQI